MGGLQSSVSERCSVTAMHPSSVSPISCLKRSQPVPPRREYVAVNEHLAAQEDHVVAYLQGKGDQAVGGSAVDWRLRKKTLSVEFPHKTAATRAGPGWVGKCALFITREYGSAIRRASVLTDRPSPPTPRSNAHIVGGTRSV